ncbi:hypothetical protein T459_35566 [Capsicum annuum]|uniref:Uncharacterized protein n=1 Tax=Capsicum annuum TaxID=4072 RepID=A0A2G2X1Y0_CAPAN|nr:hypothetical protein T459_35566 [Capsicum annuum]
MAQKEEEDEIDESVITEDSEVTDPSTEAKTECSPSELACAESESNSHASSELTDSAIDESEIQSPTSRTRGATRSKAKNSSKSDQNLGTSNSIQSPNAIYLSGECLEFPFLT